VPTQVLEDERPPRPPRPSLRAGRISGTTLVVAAGGVPQTWDQNGNLVVKPGGDSYTWDVDDSKEVGALTVEVELAALARGSGRRATCRGTDA
jgi:hypothetical protein